jgi:type IV pilus assembly protein PilA
MRNIKKGFTIIELIVVVAIIAILAAVVMFGVTQYMRKAKEKAIISNIEAWVKQEIINYAQTSTYKLACQGSLAYKIQTEVNELGNGASFNTCADGSNFAGICGNESWVADFFISEGHSMCIDKSGLKDNSTANTSYCMCN